MARTHSDRDDWEDRFFNQQQQTLAEIKSDVKDVGETANKALTHAKEAAKQATDTNSRTTHLEQAVKLDQTNIRKLATRAYNRSGRVDKRLVDLEKVLIPDKPPEMSDLKSIWADPLIRRIVFVTGAAVILAAIGISNSDIRSFIGV